MLDKLHIDSAINQPRSTTSSLLERSLLAIAVVVASLTWGLTGHSTIPDIFDSRQYAWAAWHLSHDGVFSESMQAEQVEPGVGREPLYPIAVAVLLKTIPGLDKINTECLSREEGCGYAAWRPALFLNGVFIGLTGLTLFFTVHILGFGRLAAWLSAFHIWANGQGARGREYLLSDHLAMLLVAFAGLTLVWAYQKGGWRWLIAGLACAACSLIKAIFLWAVIPALIIAAVAIVARRTRLQKNLIALLLFTMAYATPVGAWMERNNALAGSFSITIGRSAIALGTREVFDHMTPTQYIAAFVYWTRAMGDGLAKHYFAPEVWRPFDIDNPAGFYNTGQHLTAEPMINQLMAEQGLSLAAAEKIVAHKIIAAIFERPIAYAATTLPLIWRGIWVDEFIVLSFPALIWLVWAEARRRLNVTLAVAPGVFSLLFYAMTSLNIPRYQITALPTLGIAFGIGVASLVGAICRWKLQRSLKPIQ
jgi:hypothetical protein